MSTFNPSSFKRIPKANTKISKTNFELRVWPGKADFEFSEKTFHELGLEDKGLSQIQEENNGHIVISVDPLDVAVFFKGRGEGNKMRKFKNLKLTEALIRNNTINAEGKKPVRLKLVQIKNEDGLPLTINGSTFYELVAENSNSSVANPVNVPQHNQVESEDISF